MRSFTFGTNRDGVPILSKAQMDSIGEAIVCDSFPDAMRQPQAIDMDRFLTNYLGMTLDYQFLSHCGLYLGMTVFRDTDWLPVYNAEKNEAEYISVKANTVIIDNTLLDDANEHRYLFTCAHEGAHRILHSGYFTRLADKQETAKKVPPMVLCRVDRARVNYHGDADRPDLKWIEWQANYLASAILMPKSMVTKVVRHAERVRRSVNAGLEDVISVFNVSNDAAYYRMKDLQLI